MFRGPVDERFAKLESLVGSELFPVLFALVFALLFTLLFAM